MNEQPLTSKTVLCFPAFPGLASNVVNKEAFTTAKQNVKNIFSTENIIELNDFKLLCFSLASPTGTETSMAVLSALMDEAIDGPELEPLFQKPALQDLLIKQENNTGCIYVCDANDILSLTQENGNGITSVSPGQAVLFEVEGDNTTITLLGEAKEVLETEPT